MSVADTSVSSGSAVYAIKFVLSEVYSPDQLKAELQVKMRCLRAPLSLALDICRQRALISC